MSKHIGIVACSAEGAALCYQTICREGAEFMGEHAHPEISMHTHPLSKYMDYIYKGRWKGVVKLMLSSAEKLKSAGADFLICPDNTIHEAFDEMLKKSPLPWLHIAQEVAAEAKRQGFKKSAVLGTKYLMTGSVYDKAYKALKLKHMVPPESIRERIDKIIFEELVYGKIRRESKKYFHTQIRILGEKACDSVVLGCTEIPLIVLPQESPLPVLDSTRILARAALKHALKGK
ncbi:aspartate/glutamate racemase family protein [Bacteroidota bacterium]